MAIFCVFLNNAWKILGLCSKIGSWLFIRNYFEAVLSIHLAAIRFSNYDATKVFVEAIGREQSVC